MELPKIQGLAGYITVEAAAQLLDISHDGVVKILRRNNVPCVRLGRSLLVRPSDLALGTNRVLRTEQAD